MGKQVKNVVNWNTIGKVSKEIKRRNDYNLATNNIYIPNIQAKDIFINNANGINLALRNNRGEFKSKKFSSTLDYSKEQVKLREVFKSEYGDTRQFITPLYNSKNEIIKIFSDSVMVMNFDYSCKFWNQVKLYDKGKKYTAYIKYGHYVTLSQFNNCLAYENNKLVGVIVDAPVTEFETVYAPIGVNMDKMTYYFNDSQNYNQYTIFGDDELDLTSKNMRTILYNNGFDYDNRHYIRYKRANGAAREGSVLFIDENLYPKMRQYELMGLNVYNDKTIDLAGEEAYISLTLSGCENKESIKIRKNEILFVPDLTSSFNTDCIAVSEDKGLLSASNKIVEITNNLIDGEALIEADLLNGYGMGLLRERWFKACAFATRLQKYFAANNVTNVSQLNGVTLATDISQIKLVINSSCIKYLKFDKSEDAVINWLNQIDGDFYIVKHEHRGKSFDNKMVQAHYQLLNTLQLSLNQTKELLKDCFDYMNLFNTNVDVFKYHVSAEYNDNIDIEYDKVTLMELLNINENAFYTNLSNSVRNSLRKAYRENILTGHILIKGNYSVLFGNPLHYLYHTIGKQDEAQEMIGAECMTINPNFNYNDDVVLCRSPHVFCGNLALVKNVYIKEIDDYFALTDNIICLNAIEQNIMERLSSCDYDSDQAIVTNEKCIVDAVRKNYDKFGVPTSLAKPKGSNEYYYTMSDLSALDYNIAKQSSTIGEIINTSQVLQSVMWDRINKGIDDLLIQDLIKDCAMLDVMSCICIDSAKKDYSNINLKSELERLKSKYINYITNDDGKTVKPNFFKRIEELKKYDKPSDRYYAYETTMCYAYKLITDFRTKSFDSSSIYKLSDVLQINIPCNKDKITKDQITDILTKAEEVQNKLSYLYMSKSEGWYGSYLKETNAYYDYVNCLTINVYTAYKLIRMLDTDNTKINNIRKLVTVALLSHKNVMRNFFENISIEDYYEIEEVLDGEFDYELYRMKFKKVLKNPLLSFEIA